MLFYIDQSGEPHPRDSNAYSALACVAVQKVKIRDLAREVFNLKKKYWAVDRDQDFEIKGARLLSPRARQGQKNRAFVDELLYLCHNHKLPVFCIVRPRPLSQQVNPEEHLPVTHKFLLERLDRFMTETQEAECGLLVYDAWHTKMNSLVAMQVTNFLYKHAQGKRLLTIAPEPHFSDSVLSVGIQLADLIAYIVGKHFEAQSDPTLSKFYQLVREHLQWISKGVEGVDEEEPMRGIRVLKQTSEP